MKAVSYIIAILAGLSPLCGEVALASTELASRDLKNATLKIEQSHEALVTIKDGNALSAEEKEKKENEARKEVVGTAINLSLEEISTLTNRLSSAKNPEGSLEGAIQSRYLEELGIYKKYYESRLIELNSTTTSDEVKNIAKSIIDYRENIYNPSIAKIAEFALFFYTNEAIETASSRLDKMNSDIKKLEKLNIIKVNTFKAKTDKATEQIDAARVDVFKAIDLILAPFTKEKPEGAKPEKKSEESITEATIEKNTHAEEAQKEPESPRLLLESGLNKLKAAYELFLQISKDVRKAVGLR